MWAERNPFTDEFMAEEVAFYDMPEYDQDGIKLVKEVIKGRCDDYLNKAFRLGDGPATPMLFIDGKLWMSLSYSEAQSHFLPIQFATGTVATAGLGLGYFVLRVMEKPDVKEVWVFELEPRVIEFWRNTFSNRTGFEKVKFVVGDARKTMQGYEFDSVFVDIYQDAMPDEVISDIELFNRENRINKNGRLMHMEGYHFWCQEKVVLDSFHGHKIIEPRAVDPLFIQYFVKWKRTPIQGLDAKRVGEEIMMDQMYEWQAEPAYCAKVMSALGYDVDYEDYDEVGYCGMLR